MEIVRQQAAVSPAFEYQFHLVQPVGLYRYSLSVHSVVPLKVVVRRLGGVAGPALEFVPRYTPAMTAMIFDHMELVLEGDLLVVVKNMGEHASDVHVEEIWN